MKFRRCFAAVILLTSACALGRNVLGQSSDQNLPTPVLANEISGRIAALDLGDPRLTRHFYAFAGNPGDLLITLDSRNLNGDIDVFTAVTFRPLMKTTMYATSQSSEVTKGIYLRTHQILILRVEARTPNDEPGTYRISFGGTFAPFSGGIPVAENSAPDETAPERAGANRLSSVGATIPRPVEEVAAEPKPSPEAAKDTETPKTTAAEKPRTTTRRTTPRNPRRGSRPAPAKPAPAKKTESTEKTTTETVKTEAAKEAEEKPAAVSEKVTETTAPTAEKPKTQEVAPQPAGAHLIIEEKDGTRIDRPMSTVRRVIVEGGTIVIVLKTGRIERILMADVARFSIEPQ